MKVLISCELDISGEEYLDIKEELEEHIDEYFNNISIGNSIINNYDNLEIDELD